jgi:formate/nitrite transporter FocA (FNT family)
MSSEARRREVGDSDAPVEDALDESFQRIVSEGSQRLHRTWRVVLVTGTFGGMEIGVGVMAYLAVQHATGNHLLAGLAFGIGFMILLLAKSELFTENFLVPITAVTAGEAGMAQLLKLYAGTLVANLVAGWLFMWLVVLAFPQWTPTLTEAALHYVDAPLAAESICLAVLGGSTITLMTRMQQGASTDVAKILAGFAGGFLLAGLQLFHSILDSLLIFGAIHVGAPIGYGDWLRWFGYTVVLNVIGGLGLVTALRLVRSKELVERHRQAVAERPA